MLVHQAGLRLDHYFYDSTGGHLMVSEMYQRDISLAEFNPDVPLFSFEEMQSFSEQSRRLNQEKRSDQAAFYLVKSN